MADDTSEKDDDRLADDSRALSVATDDSPTGDDPQRARLRPVKPRRRWPWVVALLISFGLLATSAAMTYEMSERSNEWSAQVEDITATSYELGNQVAETTAQNVTLNDEIDLLEEQLSNNKDTVLKLSDEKAQWRDDTEFAQQQVDATADLLASAASVANGLQRCTEGQLELINTITGIEEFDPEAIALYQASVTELCDKAQRANVELQEALAQ
ncbi:hypothetical protein [Demequina aurantiaca]|uniref:hypothetical protein n=1 Tax=Demequina aurantiaca TaxID=676200 RepID=UPI003D356359